MTASGERRGARIVASTLALVASAIALSPARSARSDAPPPGDLAILLGFKAPPNAQIGDAGAPRKGVAGQPNNLAGNAAFSAAVAANFGGPTSQNEVALLADWDGKEDLTADRGKKVAELAGTLTRVAISEHTIANGFNENVFYWGDSIGNVYVGFDNTGDGFADITRTINLPTVLNAFGTLESSDQIVVTGLAVCPVADLTSFANVNGSYAPYSGFYGEILYVTFEDPSGGLRLVANGEVVHSGLLAFPVDDNPSPATAPPAVITTAGDPITMGGSFGVAFSTFHNLAGCAVDDDGSIYFHQVDLDQLTGGNIVKVTDTGTFQDRSAATSGFLTITTLNPGGGNYGTASGPSPQQVNKFTNFSGTSTTFGNVAAIAAGPGSRLYAAVARSFVATDDAATQATEGLFANPAALGPTPSMVISFSDCSGAFDTASSPGMGMPGVIPVGDGLSDVATNGLTRVAGVNNFIVYALGTGPDIRAAGSPIRATPTNTLKLSFQVDYTAYSGIVVDEESKLYLISGGTPAGVGRDPSPALGEILCFTDSCPADRRADYVDFRGDNLPNPPAAGGNVGDGDSDRFDHVFAVAPVEGLVPTPTGISGLARGFLRYPIRLAPNAMGAGVTLGQTAGVIGDDATTSAAIVFEALDPSHQVAGGDDQNPPFRGDDDDGLGAPANPGALNGGFEFAFGGPGIPICVWNGFFLNSNGNITFGAGDTDNSPTEADLRTGLPRIAGAWSDLDPGARAVSTVSFPVIAVGFAGVNDFVVRWINVPEFGGEASGSRVTMTIHLFDDGVGIDENANQPLNPANPIGNNAVPFDLLEGPTDLRWVRDPATGTITAANPRPEGSGFFALEYGRVDLLGLPTRPVLVGYSIGGLPTTNPPALCETDLSAAALASDGDSFLPCTIGLGMEPTLHEFFDAGTPSSMGSLPVPDFDLREEGNDPASCTPVGQPDANREVVQFAGVGCAPPPNPVCSAVTVVPPVVVGPHQPANTLVDALCTAKVDVLGRGFFANAATTICTGAGSQRPGATVTTSLVLAVDTDGDTIADYLGPLTNVTVFSANRVRGSLSPAPTLPGSPFPLGFCGGDAEIRLTTTVTAGDNNVFGAFTRSSACTVATGNRAPIVLTAAPSTGVAGVDHVVSLVGDCFTLSSGTVVNVTGAFAVQTDRSAHVVQATTFSIVDATHADVTFHFASTDVGKTFAIHVDGPNGLSRNLRKLRPGQDPGCPLGNEAGEAVTFTVTP